MRLTLFACLVATLPNFVALTVRAQEAAVAEAPSALAYPSSDQDVPGVGALHTEDWFLDRWRDRHATFAERGARDRGAVVFFGDSITEGWGDDFRGKFGALHVANRGISGDTTRGLLIRLDEDVLALDPTAIVMLIGTNDIGRGVAPQDVADNMKLLLDRVAAHDAQMPVILCAVMPTSTEKERPTDKIRALSAALAAVAQNYPQVTMLDTYTLFANEQGDAKLEEFPDLLHPNEVGYDKWRAALQPLLATAGLVETEADDFEPEDGFTLLFNGRDLTGWGLRPTTAADRESIAGWKKSDPNMPPWPIVTEPVDLAGRKSSPDGRYAAINGRLVVTTPSEGRRIQQIYTTADFPRDFTLKLEFRATPNADSGVYLRGRQLQCRDYGLAGPYKALKNYKPQDWNELVVVVKGAVAHCTVNGEVVEDAYELPETGPIGFEGDRGQMEYRRIRIKS